MQFHRVKARVVLSFTPQ